MIGRTKTAVLAISLLLIAAPGVAEEHVRLEQEAEADWMIPTARRNHFRWYFAWGWNNDSVVGSAPSSLAAIGSGHCVQEKSKNSVSVMCMGRGYIGGRGSSFTMSPDASTAELRVKDRSGRTHHANWTATGLPDTYGSEEVCIDPQGNEEGRGYGGGLWRDANATGKIKGRRLTQKTNSPWTMVLSGAMVSQCSRVQRSITEDGRAFLKVTLPR